MRKLAWLCWICSLIAVSANAAVTQDQAIDAGLNAAKASLSALETSRAPSIAQVALNALIAKAVGALREKGFVQDADRAQTEWNTRFANALTDLDAFGLGDHRPLSRWLADFYSQLRAKLGGTVCRLLGLDDIFVFNYGIPVALHPRGFLGDSWTEQEYARHFVPVTGAITFWVSNSACTSAVSGIAANFCAVAASIVRGVVERSIAPSISDFVYERAQGSDAGLPDYDFDRLTEEAHRI